ncbi:hypothetical protein QQ045_000212 [Rhodiola kirilowii]
MFAQRGCLGNGRNLFDERSYRNIVTWNVLISGGGEASNCYKLFMQTTGEGDIVLWTRIMTVFVEPDPISVLVLFLEIAEGRNGS